MSQQEIRDTDPLCKHDNIAISCSECADERRQAAAEENE